MLRQRRSVDYPALGCRDVCAAQKPIRSGLSITCWWGSLRV